MVTYFCGCCSLRLAVRNISIYTGIISIFDIIYCSMVQNELIYPEKFIYKYPPDFVTSEVVWFLLLIYGLLAISSIPLFASTIKSNISLVLPYLAIQMAKLLSEILLLLMGIALAPWNIRHAQITCMLLAIRGLVLCWDVYLMATVFSFMQVSILQ